MKKLHITIEILTFVRILHCTIIDIHDLMENDFKDNSFITFHGFRTINVL